MLRHLGYEFPYNGDTVLCVAARYAFLVAKSLAIYSTISTSATRDEQMFVLAPHY